MDNTTYSTKINNYTFQMEVPEYYQPALPEYFKRHLHSGYAVVNGRIVSDEEYFELTGEHVDRDDFIPAPLYVGEPLNMCISPCSTATIIDMDQNLVPFRFINMEDMPKVAEIIEGYLKEMYPYIDRSAELKRYIGIAQITMGKIREAYKEMKHDFNIRHNIQRTDPLTFFELLNKLQ